MFLYIAIYFVPEKHELLHSSAPPGNVFPLSLRLFEVSGAKFPVIVFGGHDSRIHILAARELGVYQSVCRLSGHEDWVTSLAIMKEGKNNNWIVVFLFLLMKLVKDFHMKVHI